MAPLEWRQPSNPTPWRWSRHPQIKHDFVTHKLDTYLTVCGPRAQTTAQTTSQRRGVLPAARRTRIVCASSCRESVARKETGGCGACDQKNGGFLASWVNTPNAPTSVTTRGQANPAQTKPRCTACDGGPPYKAGQRQIGAKARGGSVRTDAGFFTCHKERKQMTTRQP